MLRVYSLETATCYVCQSGLLGKVIYAVSRREVPPVGGGGGGYAGFLTFQSGMRARLKSD